MVTTARKLNLTDRKLIVLLTENTGRSLLDSGDYYGRNWQRNQARDFFNEPSGRISAQLCSTHPGELRFELSATINTFHWLRERLTYNPQLQGQFTRWQNRNERGGQLRDIEAFVDSLTEVSGIYGDGGPVTVNTYNHDSVLDQVIQFVYFEREQTAHVILQIHGGCDVRGGYTDGVCFDVNGELAIFDDDRLTIGCQRGCVAWDSDNAGYRFESDAYGSGIELESLTPTGDKPDYVLYDRRQSLLPGVEMGHTRHRANTGQLWIDESDKPHCPCCGAPLDVYTL